MRQPCDPIHIGDPNCIFGVLWLNSDQFWIPSLWHCQNGHYFRIEITYSLSTRLLKEYTRWNSQQILADVERVCKSQETQHVTKTMILKKAQTALWLFWQDSFQKVMKNSVLENTAQWSEARPKVAMQVFEGFPKIAIISRYPLYIQNFDTVGKMSRKCMKQYWKFW